ncbi:MAG: polyphenol oxidase family protein [Solirubrobacteraceae bacterium]
MELAAPFFELGGHFAIDLPGARAVFSTRRGGFSHGPYESLNLGVLTEDEPGLVARNRQALTDAVSAPPLRFVHQVHGIEVRHVTAAGADGVPLARVDGQVTDRPGVAPAALTADCLPVAIAGGGSVAMLHAGWRGLAGGIITEGVRALRELGTRGELVAAIGPGAGPCCYEVGEEVHVPFAAFPDVHVGRNLDLKGVARHELQRAGVTTVADIGICTICSPPELLFSHRRDDGITGRQAGLAWLT